ncbi:helix-hairpin-helix domain-containing protein [Rathayibacter sp. VKM Ac-2835]|uniref:helix-hairpin-helix domain-containing protein n=1 Tax=Rathayibacter sp. VKM Ac-2835 TaxID=2739043 RepID=UPI0015634022|nr:helix-hairpin-helix domain-containing protein [Rathayibacter sp. VKM Ac-2835]
MRCENDAVYRCGSQSRQLSGIGAPAARALDEAGVRDVDAVRRVGLDHLASLHGVGPKTLRLLRHALATADAHDR